MFQRLWRRGLCVSPIVVGAGLYAEMYSFYKVTVSSWGDFGKKGLPETLGVNHWVFATVLAVLFGYSGGSKESGFKNTE